MTIRNYSLTIILVGLFVPCLGQVDTPLFRSTEPLNLQASGSIKSIKKKTNDSTFVTGKFQYEQSPGNWVTLSTQARVRGNFRLRYCYFPPLKLKFKKSDIQSTIFEGNKSLKLVVPCRTSNDKNMLIRKEYLCYRFYQTLSPYHFKTRLANLKLTEISNKKPREYELLSFFVEDNSNVAKRSNGRILESRGISPKAFDEKQALRNDYFQYMIGNADWSSVYQHNTNVLYTDKKYITLSYDFDMAGFVNAGYAKDNPPNLGTGDPRERVYRGFCKSQEAMQEIRKEYLEKEASIHSLIDQEASNFSDSQVKEMHSYLEGFFDILKSDNRFKMSILEGCRANP